MSIPKDSLVGKCFSEIRAMADALCEHVEKAPRGPAAGGATTWSFTHLELAKTAAELAGGLPGQAEVTTLQSRLSYYLLQRGFCGPANLLRTSGAQVSRYPVSTGVGSAVAGVAIVEAGFSIYCGYKCS